MGESRDIRESIQHLAGTHENDILILADAIVDSVEIESRTCTVTLIDSSKPTQRDDVRLLPSIDDGFLIIPDIGTTITIIFSTFTAPVIVSYSGWNRAMFNGGELGGLAIVPVLIKKINALENMLNDLSEKYNSHIHPVSGPSTGPTTSTETMTITPTEQSEIENTSITHGQS
jgi:hypothetical protein